MTALTKQQQRDVEQVKFRIAKARAGGVADNIIRAELISQGWPAGAVEQAFGEMRG